jgi:crotonobetainyl-CoA:carnitine CoA-transferase CaiB-like acyl-CoA transferase
LGKKGQNEEKKVAGPLKGLKILDFTTLLPGPYATMTLADLGADVLRIVSGSRPDLAAFLPPFLPGTDLSCAIAYLGRGKRCMALNLKDPRAVAIVRRLVADYDIVIEQFRPGVMAKLGLNYETLKAANPALIYCSLTGYGQTGPLKNRAGHDINYLARSGIISYSGRKASGPCLTGIQIADVASGSNNAVIGILAAVVHRQATGQGQQVDVSMTDGAIAFNALSAAAYLVDGTETCCEEGVLNGGSLYDFYETKDGKYLSFGGLEPQFLAAFCETIGRPDLIAGGVVPPDLPRVKEEVRRVLKTKARDEWMALFTKVDACVEPVLSLGEALADPHVEARGLVVEVPLPGGGTVRQPGHPIRYSATPPEYRSAGCTAGTHTREVLRELGYTEAEIGEFEKTGLFR